MNKKEKKEKKIESENSKSRWYAISVYTGFEDQVVNELKKLGNLKFKDSLFEVILIEIETQNKTKKNLYPGYVFANAIMSDEILYAIKSLPGVVSKYLKQKPNPISFDEMESLLKRIGRIEQNMYFNYEIGDYVRIISGALSGNEGKIISINKETGLCKIETFFFGKYVPTEIEFKNIEKINI